MTKQVLLFRVSRGGGAVYGIVMVTKGHQILAVFRTIENADLIFPDGNYELVFEHSPRFDRMLWEIYGVVGRSECKFHVANYPEQLEGCVGVGLAHQDINGDGKIDLAQSGNALDDFHANLRGLKKTSLRVITL